MNEEDFQVPESSWSDLVFFTLILLPNLRLEGEEAKSKIREAFKKLLWFPLIVSSTLSTRFNWVSLIALRLHYQYQCTIYAVWWAKCTRSLGPAAALVEEEAAATFTWRVSQARR